MSFAFEVEPIISVCIHQWRFALDNIELLRKSNDKEDGNENDTVETGSKCPRTQGGRIMKGHDFWARVDAFFVDMINARGHNLTSSHWKE